MYILASLYAVALYLVPVAVTVAVLSHRTPARGLVRVLDASLALGLDAVVILLCAFVFPLWQAVWIARVFWLALAAADLARRKPAWRDALVLTLRRARFVLALTGLAGLVCLLFVALSYGYIIWDRNWHIPLTSFLRGERIPLRNVYAPLQGLRYHFLGNVIAASIQTLSCGVLNAANALSLAHDLYASLAVITLYGTLRVCAPRIESGPRSALAVSLMLAGPLSFFRSDHLITESVSLTLCGHSYFCLLTVGFRPHTMPAVFFLTSVLCAVALRARELDLQREIPGQDTSDLTPAHSAAVLIASVAALSLLDEASLGMLGVALGVLWLCMPGVYGPRWWHGLAVLAGLAVTLAFMQLVFRGALAPGGPVNKIDVLPKARMPGVYQPQLLLTTRMGRLMFLGDGFPLYAPAIFAAYTALRTRARFHASLAIVQTVVAVLGLWALVKLEVNKDPEENQRFVTVGFVLGQAILATLVATGGRAVEARVLAGAGLLLVSLSSLGWYRSFVVETMFNDVRMIPRGWGPVYSFHCREATGELRTQRGFRYVEGRVYWLYAGCQPSLLAGRMNAKWKTAIEPTWDAEAMQVIRSQEKSAPLEMVVCASDHEKGHDGVCAWATQRLQCKRPTSISPVVECPVSASQRDELLRMY